MRCILYRQHETSLDRNTPSLGRRFAMKYTKWTLLHQGRSCVGFDELSIGVMIDGGNIKSRGAAARQK